MGESRAKTNKKPRPVRCLSRQVSFPSLPYRVPVSVFDLTSMGIGKKVPGAKQAWKSLASGVQSKLRKLNISKAKIYATRLLSGLNSIRRRLVSPKRLGKRQALSVSALRYDHHYKRRCGQQQLQNGFAAIYVDQLFEEAEAGPREPSKGKEVAVESGDGGKATTGNQAETKASGKSGCTVRDAWKAAVVSSPQLRGVDERADEFIFEFHRRMKHERENSILDFQEMLERSA